MTTDLNTLLTGLYVKIDEYLGRPVRPGRPPKLTDAELLTLAVAQVLLGVDPTGAGRARWVTRWKPALNAFAITFGDRFPAAETY